MDTTLVHSVGRVRDKDVCVFAQITDCTEQCVGVEHCSMSACVHPCTPLLAGHTLVRWGRSCVECHVALAITAIEARKHLLD